MQAVALRLTPQQDLKAELDRFAQQHQLEAACVLTCVGSLTRAALRLANQPAATIYEGHFEILTLSGVFSHHGGHYHLAIADGEGRTYGGHLLKGCLIYTTAEIAIGILPRLSFRRELDAATGYRELAIVSELADTSAGSQNMPG